jgi:hypothetical protein
LLSVSVGISLTHQRLMVVTLGDSVNNTMTPTSRMDSL